MNVIGAGSALLLSEAPFYKPHLWFVLTDPDAQGEVVAVMMRTVTRFTDDTVKLNVGDHPFIKHESAIHYSAARRFKVATLVAEFKTGRCHLKETDDASLVTKLRQGLLTSPYTVHPHGDHCETLFKKP